jgi:mono/diheme cytochrome c family protein
MTNPRLLLIAATIAAAAARGEEPSGKQLYLQHCASCHGKGAKGDGPVAPSLKTPPTDLTTLSARKVSEAQLMEYIDGRRHVVAHGPREMPVWGGVFDAEMKVKPYSGYTVLLRAKILAEYVLSVQAK